MVEYSLRVDLGRGERLRLHVSADERYQLDLDGVVLGDGPERSDLGAWAFDTYEIELDAGSHTLTALTWAMGPAAPRWQVGAVPGLLVAADDEESAGRIDTGTAPWVGRAVPGFSFHRPFEHDFFSVGWNIEAHLATARGEWRAAEPGPWGSTAGVRTRVPTTEHLLRPAQVPALLRRPYAGATVVRADDRPLAAPFEAPASPRPLERWQAVLDGRAAVRVPADRRERVLLDTRGYVTGRLRLVVSGGEWTRITVHWAEALVDAAGEKGHRDEISSRRLVGIGDEFVLDGGAGRILELPMLLRAGRYVVVHIETRDTELDVERIELTEIRYPNVVDSTFETDDPTFLRLLALAGRTYDLSCQDTFIDGPYYEQMMWAGDGVQNSVVTLARHRDSTLIRRWLSLLDQSRDASGLACARWPARDRLVITPYVFHWIHGLHEYTRWRDDRTTLLALLPGIRASLDAVERYARPDGLLGPLPGWSFVDWVPEWDSGVPPGADDAAHAVLNWHWAMTLTKAAALEALAGEPERHQRLRRAARQVVRRCLVEFWDPTRQSYRDTRTATSSSAHASIFAILSEGLDVATRALTAGGLEQGDRLTRTTPQFGHFAIEAHHAVGSSKGIWRELRSWDGLLDRGFHTLPEQPEPTRSDCHGWSAHPLFHSLATVAGVRPSSPGFGTVSVRPHLGPLPWVRARVPHPRGWVEVELERTTDGLAGTVTLPDNTRGTFDHGPSTLHLEPGHQTVRLTTVE